MALQKLQVQYFVVEKIKKYEGNPKFHSPKRIPRIENICYFQAAHGLNSS